MDKYSCLRLDNQLCFPLYACSRNIIKKYGPLLAKFDLTYTQYIVMIVLWEQDNINVKDLGQKLYLDSGTLTPLLKNLESKGYINRVRNNNDERIINVCLTKEGKALQDKVLDVPLEVGKCLNLNEEEAQELYRLLYKVLRG